MLASMHGYRLRARTLGVVLLTASPSLAGGRPPEPPAQPPAQAADAATERGRQAFVRGVELSRGEQWGEALAAFEEAAAARDAPLVEFNIAYCQRALGRYVVARRTLQRVLRDPTGLAPSQVDDARAYVAEFDKLLVLVDVSLDPPGATLTVDGRPLAPEESATHTFVATQGAAADAKPVDEPRFSLLLDPGIHVFQAARAGHEDAVVRRSYKPGDHASLDLHLDTLPATIAIRSEPGTAIVHVDGREVGLAPIEFQRQAGTYKLEVSLARYDTYKATLDLKAGQRADLTAKLNPYRQPITERWWFWTGAGLVVAGGVALTYALTRPAPQPPPYDPGTANWVAHAQGLRF
jgi:hypothetical protein